MQVLNVTSYIYFEIGVDSYNLSTLRDFANSQINSLYFNLWFM